jgi:hypothetical protein
MNRSMKRPPAGKQQGPATAPTIPAESFVPENPFKGFVPLLDGHGEQLSADATEGKKVEQASPERMAEATAEGGVNEDKLPEEPVGLPTGEPAEATAQPGEKSKEKAEDQTTEDAKEEPREEATQDAEQGDEEAAELPPELWQEFPQGVDDAGTWYDDPDFLTLRRDEALAAVPAVRVTASSLSKVVSEAKKLGRKANELNRTGAHQRHLAVIARWYEGDRWLAIHEFLIRQGRRPEWVPLYEAAGVTAKQISRATRLRRAFAKAEDLKEIPTLEEAERQTNDILNSTKNRLRLQNTGATHGTGLQPRSNTEAPAKEPTPGTEATKEKAPAKGKRKSGNRRTSGKPRSPREKAATLPPDPADALEEDYDLRYGRGDLLDMGVQYVERALGRGVADESPFGVEDVLDVMATVASAADSKVRDIDRENQEARESVQSSVADILQYLEGPARLLDPTRLLEVAASWVSLATDEILRLQWDDPKVQCDVDKALDAINGNLLVLKKRREEGQQ